MGSEKRFAESYFLKAGEVKEVTGLTSDEEGLRARFHDRIFTFKDSAFSVWDGDTQETKSDIKFRNATLLLSPEGEQLVKSNRGLLRALDAFLLHHTDAPFERGYGKFSTDKEKEVTEGEIKLKILFKGGGSQSRVWQVSLPTGEDIILKRPKDLDGLSEKDDLGQPYFLEMLQIQELSAEFAEMSAKLHVYFNIPFFASGQVVAAEFIQGSRPIQSPSNREKILQFHKALKEYINAQTEKGRGLWRHVASDFVRGEEVKWDNFIEKDGQLICIDPLYKDKSRQF